MSLPTRKQHPFRTATLLLALLPWTVIAEDGARDLHQPVSPDSATRLAPIMTTVSGAVRLPKDRPVAIEYGESPKLTHILRGSLSDAGFRVLDADANDAVLVRVRGVLQLNGKHTARIRIAELAEKGTLVGSTDPPRPIAPADVGYVIAAGNWLGRLVDSGQITGSVGAFLFLDVVGQATGAKDWFNKAVGGDRRGICLINCENWNKTRQAAFQVIELKDGEARERIEIRSELLAEELQPGRVVSAGLAALLETLSGKPAGSPVPPGKEHAITQD